MCGFVVVQSKTEPVEKSIFENSLATLSHRGPDHQGVWISQDRKNALGHARLSIIDLNTGNQPIVDTQNGIVLVANGELYGYLNLRKDLQTKGYPFQTQSDSEIIIPLYLEYGVDLVEHLRGEFAFVLYDEKLDRLFAARDRFGIKPLCYYQDNEKLIIASEAKAFFPLGVERAWDEDSFLHATHIQYQPTHKTFFKNIFQLSPGHWLLAKGNTLHTPTSPLRIEKYWDLSYPQLSQETIHSIPSSSNHHLLDEAQIKQYTEQFTHILTEAVSLRLESDVPVCFHLSGGLDSSSVVGIASQILPSPLNCFTVAFPDFQSTDTNLVNPYNERSIAEATAKLTQSNLHVVEVRANDILTHLEDAVYFSEGLAINGHISAKYILNQAIRGAGFKVALTGEGADEVLAGYPHLREDLLHHSSSPLSIEEKKQALTHLYGSNTASVGVQLAQGEGLDLKAIQTTLGFQPSFLQAKASLGLKLQGLLHPDLKEKAENTDYYQNMINCYDLPNQLIHRHPVHQSLYLWTKLTLVNYILNTLGDGCEMAHSVEGRLPFLDHHLFEYVKALPFDLKIRHGVEKYILREGVKHLITPEIYQRQKHPFMAPPLSRFQSPQAIAYIQDHLTSQKFKTMGRYDPQQVAALLNKLPTMSPLELTAHEPVMMFLLSSFFLHQRYQLAS
ncbi:MAG: asparagine synthase (glutamine-hydrolyzing) [Cyanobacteria bacterium]|nr:asparagine synthase (glutamine-hydrolyzing) [Cyanobacteriota bacterium]